MADRPEKYRHRQDNKLPTERDVQENRNARAERDKQQQDKNRK